MLKRLLTRGYGVPVDLGSGAGRLVTNQLALVAKALNRGDLPAARLALLRLGLPPLPSDDRARLMAEADRQLRQEAGDKDLAKVAGMGLGTGAGRDHYLTQPRDEDGRWTEDGGVMLTGGNGKQPAKASSDGKTVTIEYPDGRMEQRSGGTRPWRTNNPSSITISPNEKFEHSFAARHGAIGQEGILAIFPDRATGLAAQEALLKTKRYRDLTIDEVIDNWAPKGISGNDPKKYKDNVHAWSGLTGNEKHRDLSDEQRQRFMAAQRRQEDSTAGTITYSTKQR